MKKHKLRERLGAKILAFFLMIISFITAIGCGVAVAFLVEEDFYIKPQEELLEDYLENQVYAHSHAFFYSFMVGDTRNMGYYQNINLTLRILDENGEELYNNCQGKLEDKQKFTYTIWVTGKEGYYVNHEEVNEEGRYTIEGYLDRTFPYDDAYGMINDNVKLAYSLRFAAIGIGIGMLLLGAGCFVFLMCSAGHCKGQDGIQPGVLTSIPLDIYTFLMLGLMPLEMELLSNRGNVAIVIGAVVLLLDMILGTIYCMDLAIRLKLGKWWRNTAVYFVLHFIGKIINAAGRGMKVVFHNLSFLWKTILIVGAITVLEFGAILACWWETDNLLIIWMLEKIVLIPLILYLALVLRRLQRGSIALAEGNLNYQVDTKYLYGDFKEHGENLNHIGEGMTRAVEQQLKSERMKTELITNVSHDIKTPLTSIINYADLIGQEETENAKVKEYAQVLLRQSERLKKLIENLVEASKASTGNMEVQLAVCEVGVLLTQTAGEYEQRLNASGLELITRQPEHPVYIMADGRMLWRVFDNLMNNICKYGQRGTRVYLSLEETEGKVLISFKNISHYPLDISTEELLERFTRGDRSRHTEGNGLGLSIAQSLTQLQKGELQLTVDGDFFKVVLVFERYNKPVDNEAME